MKPVTGKSITFRTLKRIGWLEELRLEELKQMHKAANVIKSRCIEFFSQLIGGTGEALSL